MKTKKLFLLWFDRRLEVESLSHAYEWVLMAEEILGQKIRFTISTAE